MGGGGGGGPHKEGILETSKTRTPADGQGRSLGLHGVSGMRSWIKAPETCKKKALSGLVKPSIVAARLGGLTE